jgi:phosphoribosyl-AMP cyclohydrolase / phosphoribosyl-ATP pyrophosphohydrolase
MTGIDIERLDFDKGHGLLPAIVQHEQDGRVLMLGYVNRQALAATLSSGRATFYSRSKQRLWTKGERSGHFIKVSGIATDCDRDTVLLLGRPEGPVCHQGTPACFPDATRPAVADVAFLAQLEAVLRSRSLASPEQSYTAALYRQGRTRIAQKLGEEAVEVALAAASGSDAEFIGECADLIYHLLVALGSRGLALREVVTELARRHAERASPKAAASDYT